MLFSIILPLNSNLPKKMSNWKWIMSKAYGAANLVAKTNKQVNLALNLNHHLLWAQAWAEAQLIQVVSRANLSTRNQLMRRKRRWRMLCFKGLTQKTRMIVIVINRSNLKKWRNLYNKHQKLIFLIWVDQVHRATNRFKAMITYSTWWDQGPAPPVRPQNKELWIY